MQTDRFLFTSPEKALDKIERLAACYEFSSKEVLQIRLLAEEIISVVSPTLKLSKGGCCVSTDATSFAVTIDCDGGVNALDRATKDALMKMGQSGKKGIGGVISKVFEFLSVPDVDFSRVSEEHVICNYAMEYGYSGGYHWNTAFFDTVSIPAPKASPKKPDEHNLELSIIEGFADDIRVGLKRTKSGLRLQITVVKKFTEGQIANIEIAD